MEVSLSLSLFFAKNIAHAKDDALERIYNNNNKKFWLLHFPKGFSVPYAFPFFFW